MNLKSLIPWRSKQNADDYQPAALPAAPLNRMRYEMDRLFDRFFSNPWGTGSDLPSLWSGSWAPSLDVTESENEVTVRAELPGVDPKDVEITVTGDVLTLSGQKQNQREERDKNYFYSECQFGSFRRSLRLPSTVDRENVVAEYSNGILSVRLKKAADAVAKRIPVKTSSN